MSRFIYDTEVIPTLILMPILTGGRNRRPSRVRYAQDDERWMAQLVGRYHRKVARKRRVR